MRIEDSRDKKKKKSPLMKSFSCLMPSLCCFLSSLGQNSKVKNSNISRECIRHFFPQNGSVSSLTSQYMKRNSYPILRKFWKAKWILNSRNNQIISVHVSLSMQGPRPSGKGWRSLEMVSFLFQNSISVWLVMCWLFIIYFL